MLLLANSGQKFPLAISLSAAFSSSASASSRLSVALSSSRSLPLGVSGVQAAGLVAPPVVGRFADLQFPADISDVLALGQQPISLTKQAHDLLGSAATWCSLWLSLPAHDVGRKTLTQPGSTQRG